VTLCERRITGAWNYRSAAFAQYRVIARGNVVANARHVPNDRLDMGNYLAGEIR
jgi:hypothetical protein